MLSKILKRQICADCRCCCSFKKDNVSLFPVFSEDKVPADYFDGRFDADDTAKEVACPFLDRKNGCSLDEQEKPFECRIWPLHVMQKGNDRVITLSPSCPVFHGEVTEALKTFLIDDRMGNYIFCHADMHPEIVKDYIEGYQIIMNG
ncbi:MAG: hypothetical protein K6C99_07765 [Lachnospiraceae bacterium]|nr:hypothetical protein [Lachnospiraceae bacterium]